MVHYKRISLDSLDGAAHVCTACGSMVFDYSIHNRWHEELKK
jgi:hypothetical protein